LRRRQKFDAVAIFFSSKNDKKDNFAKILFCFFFCSGQTLFILRYSNCGHFEAKFGIFQKWGGKILFSFKLNL